MAALLVLLAALGVSGALERKQTSSWELCADSAHELHSQRCRNLNFFFCLKKEVLSAALLNCTPPTLVVYMETFFYNHTRRRKGEVHLFPLGGLALPTTRHTTPCTDLAAVKYLGRFRPDFSFDNYTFVLNEAVNLGHNWTTKTSCGAEANNFPPVQHSERVIHRIVAARVSDLCPLTLMTCEPLHLHGVPSPLDFTLHALPSGQRVRSADKRQARFVLGRDRYLPLFVRWRGSQSVARSHQLKYGFPHPSQEAHFFASLRNQEQILTLVVLPFNTTIRGYPIAARFDSFGQQDAQTSNYSLTLHLVNYYGLYSTDSLPGESWFKQYWGPTLTNLQEGCVRRCNTYHWGGVTQESLGAPYPINVWPHLNHHEALEQTLIDSPTLTVTITSAGPPVQPLLPCASVPPEVMLVGSYRRRVVPGHEERPLPPNVIGSFHAVGKADFVWEPQLCTGGLPQLGVTDILHQLQHYQVYSVVAFGDSLSGEAVEMMSDLVCSGCGLGSIATAARVNLTGGATTSFDFRPLHHGFSISGAGFYLNDAQAYSRALLQQLGFSESTDPAVIAQELAAAPDVSLFCPSMGYVPHTVNLSTWAKVSDALRPHLANRFLHHPSPNKTFYLYVEPVPWSRLHFNTPQRTRQFWDVMTSRLNLDLTGTPIIDVSAFSESVPGACNDGLHYYSHFKNWNPQAWTSVQYLYQQIFYDRRVRRANRH
eukprot:gb/GEZN01001759.1/.p1 GENE.gb/GEZN01001759.1/~~gb/GEZN01001759.1/.p1  ORF type:complete len:709 (-),score=52.94 gb/GEZN01001759.1/:351-2477(-)